MEEHKHMPATATLKGIIIILIYYFFIFIFSILGTIFVLFLRNDSTFINLKLCENNLAILGSMLTSLLGNSIYYIRKLYKFLLGNYFNISIKTPSDKLKNIGTLLYFGIRPFFAVAFSLILLLGIKSGMFVLSGSSTSTNSNSNFMEITMFLNFFIGFSTGKFLSSLEAKSVKIMNSLAN